MFPDRTQRIHGVDLADTLLERKTGVGGLSK